MKLLPLRSLLALFVWTRTLAVTASEPEIPLLAEPPHIANTAMALGIVDDSDYLLVTPVHVPGVYLIDGRGNILHEWPSKWSAAGSARLLEDGSVLRMVATASGAAKDEQPQSGGRIEWVGVEGVTRWSHWRNSSTQRIHHDMVPLPGGLVATLVWHYHPPSELVQLPDLPTLWRASGVWSDGLILIRPGKDGGGVVVSKWDSFDHWQSRSMHSEVTVDPLRLVQLDGDVLVSGRFEQLVLVADSTRSKVIMFSPIHKVAWVVDLQVGAGAPTLKLSAIVSGPDKDGFEWVGVCPGDKDRSAIAAWSRLQSNGALEVVQSPVPITSGRSTVDPSDVRRFRFQMRPFQKGHPAASLTPGRVAAFFSTTMRATATCLETGETLVAGRLAEDTAQDQEFSWGRALPRVAHKLGIGRMVTPDSAAGKLLYQRGLMINVPSLVSTQIIAEP